MSRLSKNYRRLYAERWMRWCLLPIVISAVSFAEATAILLSAANDQYRLPESDAVIASALIVVSHRYWRTALGLNRLLRYMIEHSYAHVVRNKKNHRR